MAIRLVVAVTDNDWFGRLRRRAPLDEVNFWSPSPKTFVALQPGELFLFKLHAPINMIVGGGVFAYAGVMPLHLAWEAFGFANGVDDLHEMRRRILHYRRVETTGPIEIGCRILTQPFFLREDQWIRPPASFSRNIVSFRGYSTDEEDGRELWSAIEGASDIAQPEVAENLQARYGEPVLVRPRLGQGAFRLLVTDAYARRCAVTGERTLPALEAAHIRPYADGGEHSASNGILMRRDIHSLFDAGYVTITEKHRFEVSRRIKEDFENGRDYYALQGRELRLPVRADFQPAVETLRWHNEERFLI
jgi:putative restriction endonuclease